jgi:hypothetical protein
MLGDAILAEPGAVIGFAGPRVIKQTIGQDLPEGFQTSEFLLEHGMVDAVVHRKELKNTVGQLLASHERQAGRDGVDSGLTSYKSALDRLFARTGSTSKFGLDRTRALLALLGNPEKKFKSFHVAGTNGREASSRPQIRCCVQKVFVLGATPRRTSWIFASDSSSMVSRSLIVK